LLLGILEDYLIDKKEQKNVLIELLEKDGRIL